MEKDYKKTGWVNGSEPDMDAEHMNNIEDGIDGLYHPVFDDSGTVEGITNFPQFLSTVVNKMNPIAFYKNFKAGMAFVLHAGQLVNNGLCNEPGKYPLDAAYGKTLYDYYERLNSDLGENYLGYRGVFTGDLDSQNILPGCYSIGAADSVQNGPGLSYCLFIQTINYRTQLVIKGTVATRSYIGNPAKWTNWNAGLTNADFRIVRVAGKTTSGSNIVTATVPGLKGGKACVVTCNTTTTNHILCAAAIAENTLEVRFANNFDGVATAWISVAFTP